MKKTPIVMATITLACGAVPADMVSAQFGPIGTAGARPRGDMRPRRQSQSEPEAPTAGPVVRTEVPAAWEAVRRFRSAGRPAMLGITINDRDRGVAVLQVSPGGPADENGIEPGDVVVAVNGVGLVESEGRKRRSPTDALLAQMAAVNPGDTLTLTVRRGDDEEAIEIEAREFGPVSYSVL